MRLTLTTLAAEAFCERLLKGDGPVDKPARSSEIARDRPGSSEIAQVPTQETKHRRGSSVLRARLHGAVHGVSAGDARWQW